MQRPRRSAEAAAAAAAEQLFAAVAARCQGGRTEAGTGTTCRPPRRAPPGLIVPADAGTAAACTNGTAASQPPETESDVAALEATVEAELEELGRLRKRLDGVRALASELAACETSSCGDATTALSPRSSCSCSSSSAGRSISRRTRPRSSSGMSWRRGPVPLLAPWTWFPTLRLPRNAVDARRLNLRSGNSRRPSRGSWLPWTLVSREASRENQ